MTSNQGSQPAAQADNGDCEHDYEICEDNDEVFECIFCGATIRIDDWFAAWYLETSGVALPDGNGNP